MYDLKLKTFKVTLYDDTSIKVKALYYDTDEGATVTFHDQDGSFLTLRGTWSKIERKK